MRAPGLVAMHPSSFDHLAGSALVGLAAAIWGTWPLFVRGAGLSTPQVAFTVFAIMSAAAPFAVRRHFFRDRGATVALAGVGLADAVNVLLYFAALQRGPVALAVLTHYLAPLFVALAAPLLGGGRSRRALYAAPLSLAGLTLVLNPLNADLPLATAGLGAGSAVFYATLVLAAKRAGRTYSPLAVAALHAPISGLTTLLIFGAAALPARLDGGLALLATGSILCGLAASASFYAGLGRVPAPVASALTYLEPVAAATLGVFLFGEPLGPVAATGVLIVVAGGVWVALERETPAAPRPLTAPGHLDEGRN